MKIGQKYTYYYYKCSYCFEHRDYTEEEKRNYFNDAEKTFCPVCKNYTFNFIFSGQREILPQGIGGGLYKDGCRNLETLKKRYAIGCE